jgi:hypothetical protein
MSDTHKDKPRHQSKDDTRWLRKGGPHKPKLTRQKLKEEVLKELEGLEDEHTKDIS